MPSDAGTRGILGDQRLAELLGIGIHQSRRPGSQWLDKVGHRRTLDQPRRSVSVHPTIVQNPPLRGHAVHAELLKFQMADALQQRGLFIRSYKAFVILQALDCAGDFHSSLDSFLSGPVPSDW